ncbi:hypothetical protein ROHU_008679 [Labeo rohita]|uniref:Uncharacterized protein n=1 Tax=Labeo rohita TaxID=84645 RepID=A0A498M490_LABRO|nr:hypothetical protein ROHU_008679 [Labeo rohita]
MDIHFLPKDSVQLVDTEPAGTLVPCGMRKNRDVSPIDGSSSTAECLMVNKASIYKLFDGTTSGPAS